MRRIRVVVAIAWAIWVAGCMTLSLGPSGKIDPDTAAKLAQRAPIYEESQLDPNNYIRVGSLTASECDNRFFGGPGRDEMIAELRQKALLMGANGLIDVSCQRGTTSEVHECFSSTGCSATALKVISPGGSN